MEEGAEEYHGEEGALMPGARNQPAAERPGKRDLPHQPQAWNCVFRTVPLFTE